MKNIILLTFFSLTLVSCQTSDKIEDVVVIGGGLMGSSTAWELSKYAQNVMSIEQQDSIYTFGSSYEETRISRIRGPYQDIFSFLQQTSVRKIKKLIDFLNNRELQEVHAIEDIYTTSPVTYIYSKSQFNEVEELADGQTDKYEYATNSGEAKEKFGMKISDTTILFRENKQNSGTLNHKVLINKLDQGIRKSGNRIHYNQKVTGLKKENGIYSINITNTETGTKKTIFSKKVVAAAGPSNGNLVKDIAPYLSRLISPKRLFLAFFKIDSDKYDHLAIEQNNKLKESYPVASLNSEIFYSIIENYDEKGSPLLKIGGHFLTADIKDLDEVRAMQLSEQEIRWSKESTEDYLAKPDLPIKCSDLEFVRGYSFVYSLTESETPFVSHAIKNGTDINSSFALVGGMSGIGAKDSLAYGLIAADNILDKNHDSIMYQKAKSVIGAKRLMKDKQNIDNTSVLGKESIVYTTASETELRLTETGKATFKATAQPLENEVSVFVNPKKSFQTLLGIGGAITDASAEVFDQLPLEKQKEFLTAYYDKDKGIGYSLCRIPIHSSDFSRESFTYIEEGDKDLKTFSIAHDQTYRIPLIKKAIEATGGSLLLYASPWSPPAFMKDNNNMLQGGKLLPEYFDAWALYYTKFIKAYEEEGMPIWGITIQNEPMAVQRWESCIYTAEEERDFLKNHLGPIMEREGLGHKKIVVWDHNRDLINHRANTIFEDPEAAKYAWGIGFHWYETWAGGEPMFSNLGSIQESFPTKNLLFTEGCQEGFRSDRYQYWQHAERYGRSIINDFNNGTVGWTDWNILLNQKGGPNHASNYCFAPIHGDTVTGDLIYTPTYFYIGHFSKFIRPGAKRISTVSSRSYLLSTSFINEDNSMVNVIMNLSDEAIDYKLYAGDSEAISLNVPAHAIQTIVTK